jgi:hypothetical protein
MGHETLYGAAQETPCQLHSQIKQCFQKAMDRKSEEGEIKKIDLFSQAQPSFEHRRKTQESGERAHPRFHCAEDAVLTVNIPTSQRDAGKG